ncbi:hypothetical protein D3260_16570 [Salinisphaera sp. Q1T1-3]|nr:hypothetical protein D3260_16570 [Salinisphaera sp. Q1T1-3]
MLGLLACGPADPVLAADVVAVDGHDATIRLGHGVGMHLVDLDARLTPRPGHDVIDLDAANSFSIEAVAGCALLSADQLGRLFNRHVLAYPQRSLNDLVFSPGTDRMTIRGGMRLWHRLPSFWIPFQAEAAIALTDDGLIRLALHDTRAGGIPVAGLLDLIHTPLDRLITLARPGARLVGDTIIIDTKAVLPGPSFVSRPTHVDLEPAGLRVCFGNGAPHTRTTTSDTVPPDVDPARPYLWLDGPAVRAIGQRIAPARILVRTAGDTPLIFRLIDNRDQIAAGHLQLRTDGRLTIVPGPLSDDD